ncbi:hypothetical protein [Ovoidimarina sediminis]|uniref:hypothetical protein n=1 Tax=Ovoidimarina sediminis TaxID=3079856 RepID=UPI00290A363A|nr:hypothetical protein [Rhodophyticola sp. MJ-SS7]MDU8942763.1 hypothetical protein [Rhodophyticola sp. MJ-SS7]
MRRLSLIACLALLAQPAAARDLNISLFVFRDLDRNGMYDAGEMPLSGTQVVLEQDGRDRIVQNANLSGFANFQMSDDEDLDIRTPGPVSFTVVPPEGYEITTGNRVQAGEIRALPQAPAGLVLDPPNDFVGLAPILTIEAAADGVDAMVCLSEDGEVVVGAEEGDRFVCTLGAPGTWSVGWSLDGDGMVQRIVQVGDWPVRIPVAEGGATGDADLVERFEGRIASENIVEMGAADGFVWHNLIATHNKFYGGWGYINGTSSGEFVGYNSSGHPVTLTSDAPFDFHGALVGVAWAGALDAPVRFRAYRDGELVGEDAFIASNYRPVWFDAGWTGIDRLEISHDHYWQIVLDDITLSR